MAEPWTVVGAGVVVVVVVVVEERDCSWNAPQPLSRAAVSRENARQRLDILGNEETPECCN
jgi:hypothetical protein